MERSFHHQLMRAYYAMHKSVVSRTQKLGLSSGQPKILEMLGEKDGVEQVTIAEHCKIEPATVGNILGRMEEKGLVERRRMENNRRSLFVYLTEKGKKATEDAEQIFSEVEELAFQGIDEEKKRELCNFLMAICENLNKDLKSRG